MKQAGKYSTKTLVLWLGIFTALVLIFGTFSQAIHTGVPFEMANGFMTQFPAEQMKVFGNLIRESLQWIRI